jgi:hypothetical protein
MISWLAATIAGCVSDPRTGSGEAILPGLGAGAGRVRGGWCQKVGSSMPDRDCSLDR